MKAARRTTCCQNIEKIVNTFDEFRAIEGFSSIVDIATLRANDYNLNIRRYADNAPPPEPHDVRAHLLGGVPKAEVAAQQALFAAHGLNPKDLLVARDKAYFEFKPTLTNRQSLKSAIEVIKTSQAMENQRLARELCFVFSEIPESTQVRQDFQRVRLDRGMEQYESVLAWASLILDGQSPLTGTGHVDAPSLLFPMVAVFEAYVEKHLARQLADGFQLKSQARSHHLVRHNGQAWFRLEPDLLIHDGERVLQVLDTKWKLLNGEKTSGSDKYQLSQADFYQLYAYGQHYLNGRGDVVLI